MKPLAPITPKERFAQVLDHLLAIKDSISDDVDRVELDIWMSDGVRAKVEIRDLGKD